MPRLTEEQQEAIDCTDAHVLVSAGAGSGKTFVLVEHYLKILAEDAGTGINDIIAVTFTRKAAEEMRARLKARLKELAGNASGQDRQRWLACLLAVDSARIGTIHSLCESILKNNPTDAGIDPGFEILDDLERSKLISESIDQALHCLIEQTAAASAGLLDYPPETLKTWLQDFLSSPLKYRESKAKMGDCSLQSIRNFAEKFVEADARGVLAAILANQDFLNDCAYLKGNPWQDPDSKIGILQNSMLAGLNQIFDEANHSSKERFGALSTLASVRLAGKLGGDSAEILRNCLKKIRDAAKAAVEGHAAELNEADQESIALLYDLLKLTDSALAGYEYLKQQHQKLDFDDLIDYGRSLATGSRRREPLSCRIQQSAKGLPAALAGRNLKAVLVDEFQDTNWSQSELLSALARSGARLFFIGDDKQSIYKFQGADVSTFNAYRSLISSLPANSSQSGIESTLPGLTGPGRLLTLSKSFRSHPQIVNFVNYLFQSLFDAGPQQEEFRSSFQALTPSRQASPDESARIDVIYTPPVQADTIDRSLEIVHLEAALVADWIIKKVAAGAEVFDKQKDCRRPVSYADFAVLLQANPDFALFERSFSQYGIPYVSVAGSGFLDRQEILDLENLLKWLDCPQDSHALFAVLRSPIFGVKDELIHKLKAGKQASLWQCLLEQGGQTGQDNLAGIAQQLSDWLDCAGILPLADLLARIVLTSGYDMVLLATGSGRQQSRNVFKFLGLAARHKHMSIAEFLSALDTMRQLNVKNLTDAPLSTDNAVKIMTIHKAKGLEFAAVALPRLGRAVRRQADKLLFGKDFSIALDCSRDRSEKKPAFFLAAGQLSRRMDEEEKKRLLYVALTRARDYLGIFITPRCTVGVNFGKWLLEELGLPEADAQIEAQIIPFQTAGEEFFLSTCQYLPPPAEIAAVTPDTEKTGAQIDFSLLSVRPVRPLETLAAVPLQARARVCPPQELAVVPATIAGNYFHLLMSNLGENLELPSQSDRRALLLAHEVSVYDACRQDLLLKDAERLLAKFADSHLYTLMKTARRLLKESPYLVSHCGQDLQLRPDLIIQDGKGDWHIIDYKTDQVEMTQVSRQAAQHQDQLWRYVQDFQTLLGQPAKAWIYFAQLGHLEPVDLSEPVQLSIF
jgi:ATP-dependent helicase/nuclease subunit A